MENKDWKEGMELSKDRKWPEALAAFDRAMKTISDDPDLIHDRAVAMFNLGQQKDALKELDRAVLLQPDYSYRYASRAYMRNACKDIHGAIEDYKKAVELDPEDAIALNNLGLLEEQLGYRDEADQRFRAADELKGILKDRGIDLENAPNPKSMAESEETGGKEEVSSGSIWSEFRKVFVSKDSRSEFFSFLRNGFTLDRSKKEDGENIH